MRLQHAQIIFLAVLVVLCMGMNWVATTRRPLPAKEKVHAYETIPETSHSSSQSRGGGEMCPPCELFFRKLESSGTNGKLVQEVKVQQRGEPKSGTSFMYDWATGTLVRTCAYLQQLFGKGSCRIEFLQKTEIAENHTGRVANRKMTFEPAKGGKDARCSCQTIERVSIELSDADKHMLPVNLECAYSHGKGIDFGPVRDGEHFEKDACRPNHGGPITSQDDLWQCMHEAECDFTDEWLQMSVFRDPRPAVVSSYYHLKRIARELPTLEEFISKKLPIMCQWLAVRYTLFSGSLSQQSTEFWYGKALANPLAWHHTWFDMVGLQLPFDVVNATANGAVAYDFTFNKKHIDAHPGQEEQADPAVRKFVDQVSPEVLHLADEVLRVWLPPVLLEQLGVAPRKPTAAMPQVGLDAPVRLAPPPLPPPVVAQQMK